MTGLEAEKGLQRALECAKDQTGELWARGAVGIQARGRRISGYPPPSLPHTYKRNHREVEAKWGPQLLGEQVALRQRYRTAARGIGTGVRTLRGKRTNKTPALAHVQNAVTETTLISLFINKKWKMCTSQTRQQNHIYHL